MGIKNLTHLILFAIVILTASCRGDLPIPTMTPLVPSLTPQTTQLDTHTPIPPSATVGVIPTAIATATVAGTPAPPAASTIPPEARLTVQCLDVASLLPANAQLDGVVILRSNINPDTFLMNMATGVKTQLNKPNEGLQFFAVSPDKKWMAYRRVQYDKPGGIVTNENLVIATVDGKPQKVVPWETGWVHVPGWLDNQRLVINLAGLDSAENKLLKAATLMVLNPFTGERQTLRPNFPMIYDVPYVPDWEGWGETVYDPTLTRVVYLKNEAVLDYTYVLWDIQKHVALATLQTTSFPIPRWSPDGTRFAVASSLLGNQTGFELYSVDRDGRQMTPLTNFSAYYPSATIGNLTWSPNGRYLAFWLLAPSNESNGEEHLAILDTVTQEVTNYCVPGDYEGVVVWMGATSPLIWSPNSQQLIVENRYAAQSSRVILVDIAKGIAAQIAQDEEPVGWMVSK